MALRPMVMRLEAALDGEPASSRCPLAACCPMSHAGCRLFAPGWYCEDRGVIVLPELVLDADYEPDADDEANGDHEPDDDYS